MMNEDDIGELEVAVRRCFSKLVFLKEFRNNHRKTPVLESLFNKVAGLKACNYIKERLQHRCFPVNNVKFLRTHFFTEHLRELIDVIIPAAAAMRQVKKRKEKTKSKVRNKLWWIEKCNCQDDSKFKKHFRVSRETFEYILNIISQDIKKQTTTSIDIF